MLNDKLLRVLSSNFKVEDQILKSEAKKNYQEILIKTFKLAKELNLNNSLEFSNLFTFLLWNGYFSKTKIHTYSKLNLIDDIDLYALEIMNGIGVCLNYSQMLKDFLNISNHVSIIMPCSIKKARFIQNSKIVRNIERIKITTKINNNLGNHVTNLNVINNNYYLYDPTNLGVLKILDINKALVINGIGTYSLIPEICLNFASTFKDYQLVGTILKQLNRLEKLDKLNNTDEIDRKIFDNTWLTCMLLFNHNKKLLEDYQEDILTDVFKVSNNLEKIKVKRNKY